MSALHSKAGGRQNGLLAKAVLSVSLLGIGGGMMGLSGCSGYVRVEGPPPPPPAGVQVDVEPGVAPFVGGVWIRGHYDYGPHGYFWVAGRWAHPPHGRVHWHEAHFDHGHWHHGYWT